MEHRLIISLVTWNSAQYLAPLLASLKNQTEQSLELLITDNASTDDTVVMLSESIPSLPFPVTLFRETENTGFARAHNHHIREAIRRKARAILILNPDCVIAEHACTVLQSILVREERVGSVGGKILRARWVTREGAPVFEKQTTIDSTGLLMRRSGQWKERGYGEDDRGQYAEGQVLGVSGAFVLYRIRALMDVAYKDAGKREFFDEDFFAYKEDVDLAWRLQLFGWSSWYAPQAIAWHHRTFGRAERHRVPPALHALSWRNNFLLFVKNFDMKENIGTLCLIFFRECAKLIWILLTRPGTLQLVPTIFRLWFRMIKKRQWIRAHRRQLPQAMREIFRAFQSSSSTMKRRGS